MTRRLLTLAISLTQLSLHAIGADTMTGIHDPKFRTLQAWSDGVVSATAIPTITMSSPQTITISFDELADAHSDLRYYVTHCNADWQPDGLVDSEILDGFNDATVDDYRYSSATTVPYVNYTITFPNPQMAPKISGNYLLTVYRDGTDPADDPPLQVRFIVSEQILKARGTVLSATDIDYRDAHQQLEIDVDLPDGFSLDDAFNRLYLRIRQDGRWDNAATVARPQMVTGQTARYRHMPQLIFAGGNEYRRFENISVNYPGMRIADLAYAHPYYHCSVEPDTFRGQQPYEYDRTQNGQFLIREYNSSDPDVDADYIVTHFTLSTPTGAPLQDAEIYIDGALTHHRLDSSSRMAYDPASGVYRSAQLLKQGAYNYQYLTVPAKGTPASPTKTIEGDHYQTSHSYDVDIYLRVPGARYDRHLGSLNIHTDNP